MQVEINADELGAAQMTAFVGEAMTDADMLLCIKCLCMYVWRHL